MRKFHRNIHFNLIFRCNYFSPKVMQNSLVSLVYDLEPNEFFATVKAIQQLIGLNSVTVGNVLEVSPCKAALNRDLLKKLFHLNYKLISSLSANFFEAEMKQILTNQRKNPVFFYFVVVTTAICSLQSSKVSVHFTYCVAEILFP